MQSFDDPIELSNLVISGLSVADENIVVCREYSNNDNSTAVKAYAKIAGKNWTYFVKSLETTIGRNTDASAPEEKDIDIDLGPAKVVSRRHAAIRYNMSTRVWELEILGRNGVKIDTERVSPAYDENPVPLRSGTVIDIGGTQMMFILPDTPAEISDKVIMQVSKNIPELYDYLNKKQRIAGDTDYPVYGHQQSQQQTNLTFSNTYQQNQHQQNRQFFNPSYANEGMATQNNHLMGSGPIQGTNLRNEGSPHMSGGMDADLSKDSARDIKPPYSYATMITQAILSTKEGVLSLSEIYNWIAKNYSFYRYSKTGWQNSIRHNLSLNKAFEKVPRKPNEPGKGMKWQISEAYRKEFFDSMNSGSSSKIRRGSSVSRQLQLHLATHNDLPDNFKNFVKNDTVPEPIKEVSQNNYPVRSNSVVALDYIATAAAVAANEDNRQFGSSGVDNLKSTKSSNSLISPERYTMNGGMMGSGREVSTPSPKISRAATTNSNKENGYQKNDTIDIKTSTTGGSGVMSGAKTPNMGTSGIDLISFPSPEKGYTVSALEAYTPERGSSRNLNGRRSKYGEKDEKRKKSDFKIESPSIPSSSGGNTAASLQASPAIWNFVQFGTPNSQTPNGNLNNTSKKSWISERINRNAFNDDDDDDDENQDKNYINGSPIQQRKKNTHNSSDKTNDK